MSNPTVATLKSFVKKNAEELHIKVTSDFDPMTDAVERNYGAKFNPAEFGASNQAYTLGVHGVWLVGGAGRNAVREYSDDQFSGYSVYNCCGSFVVVTKKAA